MKNIKVYKACDNIQHMSNRRNIDEIHAELIRILEESTLDIGRMTDTLTEIPDREMHPKLKQDLASLLISLD